MSNSSLSTPSIDTSTSSQSRSLVRLLIGNVSKFLSEKTSTEFTHKWTVYVRAAGPEHFTDRSFIRKVVFSLHESFTNPEREILNPPFEVSECGFGSFDMVITIYFAGQKKSYNINYYLELLLGSDHKNETEYKIEVVNPSPEFAALIPKYCRPQTKKISSRPAPSLSSSNFDINSVTKQSKSSTNKEISSTKSSKIKDEKKQHKQQNSSKNPQKISKKDGEKKITPVTAPKKRIPTSTDCESDSAIRDLFEANLPFNKADSTKKEEKSKEKLSIDIEKNTPKIVSKEIIISKSFENKKEKIKKEGKKEEKQKKNENKLIIEKERHINSPKKISEKTKGNGEEVKKLKIEEPILPKKDKEEKRSSKDEKKNIENEDKEKKRENKKEKIKIKISEIIGDKINEKIKNKQQFLEKDKNQNNNVENELLKEKKEEIKNEKEEKRKEKNELKKEEDLEKQIKAEEKKKKKKDKEKDIKKKEEKMDVNSIKINKISEKKTENFVKKQIDEIEGNKNSPNKFMSDIISKDRLSVEEPIKKEVLSTKLLTVKQSTKQTSSTAIEKIQEKKNISPSINNSSFEVKKRKSDNFIEEKIEKKKIVENKRKYFSSSSSNSPIKPPKIAKDENIKTIEPTKIKSFEQIFSKREIRKEKTPSPITSTSIVVVEETPIKDECQENNEMDIFPIQSSQQNDFIKIEESSEDYSNGFFVSINRIDNLRRKFDLLQEQNGFGDENTEGGEEEELLFKCCELLLEQKNEGTLLNIEEKSVDFNFENLPVETLNKLENLLVGITF
uniref:AF-9 ANC1 homology domain-containing protein n=1 Tax=Meloidogyne hapla TaxID=6305 RepID=A0A1I8BY23_MELHA